MFNKKILFILCLFLVVIGMSAVSAADNSTSFEVNPAAGTPLSFGDAQDAINNPDDMNFVFLKNKTYVADSSQALNVNGNIRIFGTNHISDKTTMSTLDANGLTNIFNIANGRTVYLTNINIINSKSTSAALLIGSNANVILENVNFIDCEALTQGASSYAGAIYVGSKSTVTATSTSFIGSTGNLFGGAVYVSSGASFNGNNLNFINNTAVNGAAIYGDSNINIQNSYFYNNHATINGGALYVQSNVNITNSRFYKNSADGSAGAIRANSNINILNSEFKENTAGFGGAISVDLSFNIDGTTFERNSANYGGAIAVVTPISTSPIAQATVSNSVFNNNNATNGPGAAIYFSGDLTVKNSTFVGQNVAGGSTVFVPTEGTLADQNNIFASNLADTNLEKNIVTSVGPVSNNKVTLTLYVPAGSTGTIEVRLNKALVKTINNQATVNKYTVDVSSLASGKNNISISYSGDNNFVSSVDTIVVDNNNKANVNLVASTSDIVYGQEAVINIDCSVNGPVEVRIGNLIKNVNVVNNKATLSVPDLDVGSYPIVVTYAGDSTHNEKSTSALLTVSKAPASLSISCSANAATGLVDITSNMPGYFTIYLNGEKYDTVYAPSGTTSVSIPRLGLGNYNVRVVSENPNYNTIDANGSFSISGNFKLTLKYGSVFEGEKSPIQAFARTLNDMAMAGVEVIFTVNGEEFKVTANNQGTARLSQVFPVGHYNVSVRFANQNYGYVVDKGYFTVNPLIIAEDVVKNNNEQFTYSAKLVDRYNNPVSGKQMTFAIDGKTYTATTNEVGTATVSLKLTTGNYTLNIAANGHDIDKNVYILPKDMSALTITTATDLNNAVITATLSEAATGNIIFTVNGEKYIQPISGNKAILNLNNLPNNLYRINATLSSPEFSSISSLKTFRVDIPRDELFIETEPVEIDFQQVANLTVLIRDGLNKPLANLLVIASVNGVDYTNYTNSKGIAKFAIKDLDAGYYPVYVYCEGDNDYHAKTVESSIRVSPIDMSSMILTTTVDYNDVIITATFSDKVPVGRVVFTINGKEYYEAISNDKAILKLTLPAKGTYTISGYLNSIDFNKISNTTSFKIEAVRGVLHINVPVVEMYYQDGSRLWITVTDDRGNPLNEIPITIKINGASYNKKTGVDGKAYLGIGLNPKIYPVEVVFKGDKTYDPLTVTSAVIVKSTIISDDLVKYYNNDSHLNMLLTNKNGDPLPHVKAKININGVFYLRESNDWGIATMKIGLFPGTYIATVENPVTEQKSTFIVTVLPTVIVNDLTKYFRNGSQFIVKVVDKQGNPLMGVDIKININGVFYTRTTNVSGLAQLNLYLNPGVYIATAMGPDLAQSAIITILSTVLSEDLTMTASNRVPFKVKLLDEQGNPAPIGTNVTFNINGVFYTKFVQSSDGTALINILLLPKTYIVTIIYGYLKQSNFIRILNT